jgi:hypothetical protein
MKIAGTIIFFVFSIITPLNSQIYQSGYIVTNSNDTICGFIKDMKEPPFSKIYKNIRFRGNSLFRKKYSPGQIAGYKKGDNIYESIPVEVTSSFFRTNYLSNPVGKKTFMKVIHKGFLTYYHWEHIDHESGTIDEISLFKRKNDDYFIRVTQGIFGLRKKELKEYFQDCPELIQKIEDRELKRPDEIAQFYNDWKSKKFGVTNKLIY